MDLTEVREIAREKLSGVCNVCPICNGQACVGNVPGVGGIGNGNSFKRNIEALREYFINLKFIHDVTDPTLTRDLFGVNLKMPVLGAPLGGGKSNYQGAITDEALNEAMIKGCHEAGTLAMVGDGPDLDSFQFNLNLIKRSGGWGIPVIMPWEQKKLLRRIKISEEAGCVAIALDLDAAGFVHLRKSGIKYEPKSIEKLKEIVEATRLPVILKGIMTVEEAEKAVKAGVKGIIVSNHGGRISDCTPGTVDVLPGISYFLEEDVVILVDGGIRTGTDVLKCLALGAHGVLMGRPLGIGAIGGGSEGVKLTLEKTYQELYTAMIMTGMQSVEKIDVDILLKR